MPQDRKTVCFLYGREGMELRVPASAEVLMPESPVPLVQPQAAIREALARPIGSRPLCELVLAKHPRTVAITISDITRPVPNKVFLPVLLDVLNGCGVADSQIVIIIGTGMHRPSTTQEHEILVGDLARRVEITDHRADDAATLRQVSPDPPVAVNRRFADADFRIVTGFIEPHFMAGFSGGRKGVCPALVDLQTIQRFHGYRTLADSRAENGVLDGNPCHAISLAVARKVGVDFLFNVAITRNRQIAGVYCGDLEAAHAAGCRDVAEWTTVKVSRPYDLVITSGGGLPLDLTFYQAVKGMCSALPALGPASTLLEVAQCAEGVGSRAYEDLMMSYDGDWRRFLADIAARAEETRLDQWEYQMQARVLERVGIDRLWFACDGISIEKQKQLSLFPVCGDGSAQSRAQRAVDSFVNARPGAAIAVIPEGPYTMLRSDH